MDNEIFCCVTHLAVWMCEHLMSTWLDNVTRSYLSPNVTNSSANKQIFMQIHCRIRHQCMIRRFKDSSYLIFSYLSSLISHIVFFRCGWHLKLLLFVPSRMVKWSKSQCSQLQRQNIKFIAHYAVKKFAFEC